MSVHRAHNGWGLRLAVIGLVAVGAAWGLNRVAVWQLERHTPVPKERTTSTERPAPERAHPVIGPDMIVEQHDVARDTVEAQREAKPSDKLAGKSAAPSSAAPSTDRDATPIPSRPGASKPAASRPAASKPAASKPAASKPAASKQASPVRVFAIDTERLRQQFKGPEDTAGHGHILPHYKNGERRGLKFVGVAPGGLFGRLGISSGDVILSVNGTEITTQQKALADFEKMRELRTFDVILERHGKPRHHRYVLK